MMMIDYEASLAIFFFITYMKILKEKKGKNTCSTASLLLARVPIRQRLNHQGTAVSPAHFHNAPMLP